MNFIKTNISYVDKNRMCERCNVTTACSDIALNTKYESHESYHPSCGYNVEEKR